MHGLHINGHMPRSLDGVRMEQHTMLLANRTNFRDGLNRPHLIVGKHDRHQTGIRPNGRLHLLRSHQALPAHVQEGYLESLLLQPLQAVEDGMVLKGRGNDMHFALLFSQHGSGAEGLIVGLATTGGECDLPLPGSIQALCHILPGLQEHVCRLLARCVEGRGVAPGPVHGL